MADGQVVFEIEGDTRGIKDALRETTNAIDKESRKWENAGDDATEGISKAFTSMFKKISAAAIAAKIGQAILQIGKDAIQAASDLEEVQNVVDVTFGKSAKQVDSWAKNAIKQYGLTETQAKRFASTIGAMMKSLGMSADEVTGMSEALAGLAADMASFYNLDFDTAFNKIRSGISGETEPLKQLGINLSEANLQAFALSKNLEKTYKEMSSSEKAMLRYEYLMQATADAQGDFARTTDSLANSTRTLDSELDTLKTTVGQPLQKALAGAIGEINKLIDLFMPQEKRTTIFDQLNEIQVNLGAKETEITRVSGYAQELLNQIDKITGNGTFATTIGNIADNANKLKSATSASWRTILNGFKNADFSGITSQTGDYVKKLADGLMGIKSDTFGSRRAAWESLLGILEDNKDIISAFTGKSPDDVTNWLSAVRQEVENLTEDDLAGWNKLYNEVLANTGGIGLSLQDQLALGVGLGAVKNGVNGLDSTSVSNWGTILTTFKNKGFNFNGIDGATGPNIKALAEGLSGINSGSYKSKSEAWGALLGVLHDNVNVIAEYTGKDPTDILYFLSQVGTAANGLSDSADDSWNGLLSVMASYLGPDVLSPTVIQSLSRNIGGITTAGNRLKADSGTNWTTFLNALTKINGLENVFGSGTTAKQNIEDLAKALTGNSVTKTKAQAWSDMIDAILKSENINGLSDEELEAVKKELIGIKEAAAGLDDGDVAGWNALFTLLVSTVPGMGDTSEGKTFAAVLSESFDTLSDTAEAAAGAMEWLDVSTGLAAEQEEELWANIKALADIFPTLNKYIDFESRKIKGGLPVLREYSELWEAIERNRLAHEYANNLQEMVDSMQTPEEAFADVRTARAKAEIAVRTAMKGQYTDEQIEQFIREMYVGGALAGYRGYKEGFSYENYNFTADWLKLNNLQSAKIAPKAHSEYVWDKILDWYQGTGLDEGGGIKLKDGATAIENPFASGGTDYLAGAYGFMMNVNTFDPKTQSVVYAYLDAMANYMMLVEQYPELMNQVDKSNKEVEESDQAVADKIAEMEGRYGELTDAEKIALEWMKKGYSGVTDAIKETVAHIKESIDAMEEYYNVVRSGVESTVKGVIKGFNQLETQATKAQKQAQKLEELREENKDKKKGKKTDAELIQLASGDAPTAGGMIAGLQSQLDFMTEYQGMLEAAREFGISPALLATLADGSQESYDYLDALLDKSDSGGWKLAQGFTVAQLNETFDKVQKAREGFVDELTQTQLAIDDEWQTLVKTATDYIAELDQYGLAFANTDHSMQGVLDALKTGDASLKVQVQSIENTLSRLSKYGIYPEFNSDQWGSSSGARFTIGGAGRGSLNSTGTIFIPKHANGLDYVPYDGYLAELHKGESVLTAAEAELYRNRENRPGLDGIAGAIWGSAPDMGGDVYLDGRVVGRIISGRQANDYRALERSGWRG